MLTLTMVILFSIGFFFLFRGNLITMLFGIIFLGNAVNILLFQISYPNINTYPFITSEIENSLSQFADPIPQALILTAIVISFSFLCFIMALIKRGHDDFKFTGYRDLIQEEEDE